MFVWLHIQLKLKKKMGIFDKSKKEQEIEEEQFEEEKDTTYTVNIECKNCLVEEEYEIPFGKTVKEFLRGKKCENCKCLIFPLT